MKTSKRIVSFLLSAIMVVTTFLAVGPVFTIEASAIELGGISQERVVSNYETLYKQYQERFFQGVGTNWATDIVIPGLRQADDYTPQGMTYWPAKEWILISAYDASGAGKNSVIYALDIKTGDFVALFKVYNNNGTVNTSHGGGIAASEYNFYYADSGSNISYWPLSVMDVEKGTVKNVYIRDSINCSGELNSAATSYCCYDEGILWTGNFYLDNNNYNYGQPANSSYNSMLLGYQLRGDSSALEWDYLCANDHPITITNYTNSAQTGSQRFYVTAEKNYMRLRFGMRNGEKGTVKYSNIKVYEVGSSGTNLFNFANWASGNGGGVNGGSISVDTGAQTISLTASSTDVYSNPWNGVSGSGAVPVTVGKTYCVSYDYQVSGVSSAQLEPFVFWDDDATDNGESTHICPAFNTATNVFTMSKNDGVMTYKLTSDSNGIDITGSIKKDLSTSEGGTTIDEFAPKFASVILDEGRRYKVSYTTTNQLTDIYMFAPNGKHCNVKQSSATKITNNGNGTYTYEMEFTAGLKPTGADSSWPTTQSTDSSFSGLYSIRFDQDSVTASRDFVITDFKIEHCHEDEHDSSMRGTDCEGNPTHCIAFENSLDKIQYSMVDKGRIYISRSWSRKQGSTHTRELDIASLDIYAPGTKTLTINGVQRVCHFVSTSDSTFVKYGGTGNGVSGQEKMLYMGEALCIIDDYLYMFGEGAAYTYRAKGASDGNVCPEPIDVIWKIDQHAIVGAARTATEDIEASHYERVSSWDDFDAGSEYIIVYESSIRDRVTQKNILYLLDSFGGYGENKLPKHDNPTKDLTGDSIGVVGYKVTSYTTDEDKLYIDDTVDERKSIRWKITHNGSGANLRLENMDHYYGQNRYLNFGASVFAMSTASSTDITGNFISLIYDAASQKYYICSTNGGSLSYLWCNDGSDVNNTYLSAYTNYYNQSSTNVYADCEEIAGTFHADGSYKYGTSGGNVTGEAVNSALERFAIYKRVPDPHAFTGDSQVYTDLKAEVQSDGTINLNLETYATASLHYKELPQNKPIDYIFVFDTSQSMEAGYGQSGYTCWYSDLTARAAAGDTDDVGDKNGGTWTGNIYIRHEEDGSYCRASIEAGDRKGGIGNYYKYAWFYYTHNDTKYYYWPGSRTFSTSKPAESQTSRLDGNSDSSRASKAVYNGPHYGPNSNPSRLHTANILANELTYQIAQNAKDTGLDHRIAVCKFGSQPDSDSTGFYKVGSTSVTKCYSNFDGSQDFTGAYHTVDQFGSLRKTMGTIKDASGHSYVDYGMFMASQIVSDSGEDYSYFGDRSSCVILFTDGGVGPEGEDDKAVLETSAGSAIITSRRAKAAGANVFTVRVGNQDASNLDETAYLQYVSMDYVDATAWGEFGDRNPSGIEYASTLPTSNYDYETEAANLSNLFENCSLYGLARLDASAVLREQLDQESFSFENVSASDITIGTQKAYYDAIGRLQFEETQPDSTITADTSQANNGLITITGFDYSKNYVSTVTADDGTAKKLVITIKNVDFADDVVNMTDINRPIVDVPVSLADPTGIYMSNGEKHRSFPEDRVTIPQYTYVFDYGLGMFDVDINGTLISVDTALRKQSTYSDSKTQGNTSLTFTEDRQDMTYTINKDATDMQRYFVLIQRPNGEYDWFAINIVPATNVYFEQDIFAVSNTAKATWNPVGSTQFTNQSISLWDDIYGFDENYLADNSNYSQGAALKTTVTSSNNRSDTMKTTFNGNGFDLYSVCGPNTGVQIVKVYPTGTTDPMNFKSYVIDTFYNDTNFPGPLYQVPILRHECSYGNYTVEVTSAYLSIAGALQTQSVESAVIDENGTISYTSDFTNDKESAILKQLGFEELIGTDVEFIWHSEDSVLNGGKGAQGVDEGSFTTQAVTSLENYIDGIRVYHPGGDNMDTYYKESEKGATYYNVFDNMKAGVFSGSGISYIYGTAGGQSLNFAEELEKLFEGRPKNEVYLENSGNNSITFTVDNLDENSRVMVSLRAAQGSPKAQVNNNVFVDGSITRMEMYYDITEYLTIADGKATVIIKNAGSGLLAVDNIKVTGAGGISAQSELSDVFEIFSLDVVEVDPRQPSISTSGDIGEIPLPPVPDQPDNNEPDDGNDNILPPSDDDNPEEPAEDGFFAKVESFFVKIFNFFKNIFNKVSTFFKF